MICDFCLICRFDFVTLVKNSASMPLTSNAFLVFSPVFLVLSSFGSSHFERRGGQKKRKVAFQIAYQDHQRRSTEKMEVLQALQVAFQLKHVALSLVDRLSSLS